MKTILISAIIINLIYRSSCNVSPFDHTAIKLIMIDRTPTLFLLTTSPDDTSALYKFHQAAELFYNNHPNHSPENTKISSEQILFVVSSPNDGLYTYQRLAKYLGVENSHKNGQNVILFLARDHNKYRFWDVETRNNQIEKEDIVKFVQQAINNRVQPFYKSEQQKDIINKSKFAKSLVGSNFYKKVLNSDKQLFILFYTPICYKSRALSSKFHKTAQSLHKNPNIVFYKINMQLNEIPPKYTFPKQTPYILFYKKDKILEPVQFTKIIFKQFQQSQDYMIKWLKQNTQFQWVRSQNVSEQAYDDL